MTVTVTLPPEIEAVLAKKAELHGLALPDYLFSLAEADADDYYSLSVEEIVSIKQGLAELKAGDHGMLLGDFHAEMMARRAERLKPQDIEAVA